MDVTRGAVHASWTEIAPERVAEFATRLLGTGARVEQYPFFNERFRSALVAPRYLCCGPFDDPSAYACVLSVGFWPVRVGLVAHGPVSFGDDVPEIEIVAALAQWARAERYAFLRFTHSDADFLSRLHEIGHVEEHDPFRRFLAPESELIVPICETDEALLTSFETEARRLVKRATEWGYRIERYETADKLAELWPFFQAHAERKGLQYRPLERYAALMQMARKDRCASLYVASLEGVTINAILVLRDRDMAHYQLAALDVEALGKKHSPGCLLQLNAMRDARALGAKNYNLGLRSGSVYAFKLKFRPTEVFPPPARTVVLRPALYRAWNQVVGRYAPSLMQLLRGRRR